MKQVRVLSIAFVCAAASSASAGIVSSSPHALGAGREYAMFGPPAVVTIPSFFDVFVEIDIRPMGGQAHTPGAGPHSCPDDMCIRAWPIGAPPPNPVDAPIEASFFDVFAFVSPDGTTSTFDTEMLSLDLVGGPFMMPGLPPLRVRESPTRPSLGRYTVETLPGGLYQIDSFFDVFVELSLDDGATWLPANNSLRLELVPAPGAAALLALGGLVATRRRRA